jgi:hypothetical protein
LRRRLLVLRWLELAGGLIPALKPRYDNWVVGFAVAVLVRGGSVGSR